MSRKQCVLVCVLGLAGCCPGLARAATPSPGEEQDVAAQVRAVFSARCVRCHGPDVARPKGGFGYILDLKRLAADSDKVVPSQPDESGLWQMVHNGEMPPPNSPTGALTAQEKEVI